MANSNAVKIRPRQDRVPTAANLAHNSAMTKASYWLDDGSDIIQSHSYNNHKQLNEDWNRWVSEADKRYLANPNTKTKLRSQAVRIEEGLMIIGTDVDATPEQIKNITQDFVKRFEVENNTKVLHWAIHDHEGHEMDDKQQINRHIHFLFDNVSQDGKIIRSKWKKDYLSHLQTLIYNISKKYISDIERARDTVGQNIRGKHHRQYRREKELECVKQKQKQKSKKKLAKQVNLNVEMKALREELKGLYAERKHYAKLEEEKKELLKLVKEKNLTIDELEEKMELMRIEFEKQLSLKDITIESLQNQLELSEKRNKAYFGLNNNLKKDIQKMKNELEKRDTLKDISVEDEEKDPEPIGFANDVIEEAINIGKNSECENMNMDEIMNEIKLIKPIDLNQSGDEEEQIETLSDVVLLDDHDEDDNTNYNRQ